MRDRHAERPPFIGRVGPPWLSSGSPTPS
jgi:hypothetical protein